MADEENIDYSKEEARRYRMETSKQKAILYREWGYFALVVLVAAMLIWALYAFKMTQNVVGTANAKLITIADKLDGIAQKLEDKIDAVDVAGLSKDSRETVVELKGAISDLRTTERELPGLIRDTRQEIVGLSRGVQGLVAESHVQIKQEGDAVARLVNDSNESVNKKLVPAITDAVKATNTLMEKYGLTADEATATLKMAAQKSGKTLDEINKQVANPKWSETADNIAAATGNANLLVADLHTDTHNTMKEFPGIAKDIQKTTHNISKFSKISIIAGIISNLSNGIIPGLLH